MATEFFVINGPFSYFQNKDITELVDFWDTKIPVQISRSHFNDAA